MPDRTAAASRREAGRPQAGLLAQGTEKKWPTAGGGSSRPTCWRRRYFGYLSSNCAVSRLWAQEGLMTRRHYFLLMFGCRSTVRPWPTQGEGAGGVSGGQEGGGKAPRPRRNARRAGSGLCRAAVRRAPVGGAAPTQASGGTPVPGSRQQGSCWERQWSVPSPQTRSRAWIPITCRSGNSSPRMPRARRSWGSLKVGTKTAPLAM